MATPLAAARGGDVIDGRSQRRSNTRRPAGAFSLPQALSISVAGSCTTSAPQS
jgi:hypothetical protein